MCKRLRKKSNPNKIFLMHERSFNPSLIIGIVAFLSVVHVSRGPWSMAQEKNSVLHKYSAELFSAVAETPIPYRLLAPIGVEAGKQYPLVLFLHGAGERGNDNQKQLVHAAVDFAHPKRMKRFPAFVVFPQCPSEQRWVESAWDLPSGRGEFDPAPSKPMKVAFPSSSCWEKAR